MKAVTDPDQELLERTLRSALRVDAPGIDQDEARERADRAVARARAISRRRGRLMVGSAAVAVAAAFALVVWAFPPATTTPVQARARDTAPSIEGVAARVDEANEVSSVRLPSGDRIVADPGAHYDVESTSLDRRVRLSEGVVLFDVAPLNGGSFTVDAGEVQVRVRGTVFSVRRTQHVEVEVFEGSVEVRHADEPMLLSPGDRWTSRDTEGDVAEVARPASAPPSISEPTEAEPDQEPLSLLEARMLLRERDFAGALEASTHHDEPGWSMLRADALRGLRRWREAAEAYDAVVPTLDRARRAQASYAAARIWSDRTGDARAALQSLSAGGAATTGSPLEERARVLEIDLLQRLGRPHEARAHEYVERFPETSTAFDLRRELR